MATKEQREMFDEDDSNLIAMWFALFALMALLLWSI